MKPFFFVFFYLTRDFAFQSRKPKLCTYYGTSMQQTVMAIALLYMISQAQSITLVVSAESKSTRVNVHSVASKEPFTENPCSATSTPVPKRPQSPLQEHRFMEL
jgi:hypothetical protein